MSLFTQLMSCLFCISFERSNLPCGPHGIGFFPTWDWWASSPFFNCHKKAFSLPRTGEPALPSFTFTNSHFLPGTGEPALPSFIFIKSLFFYLGLVSQLSLLLLAQEILFFYQGLVSQLSLLLFSENSLFSTWDWRGYFQKKPFLLPGTGEPAPGLSSALCGRQRPVCV
jgi:hypothetical protein